MRRTYRWVPLAAAISVIVACGGTDVGSRWVTGAVVVDGDTEEWAGPGLTYVERLSGTLGAANNDSSLYLMVRFADPNLGRKITLGGATIWWNRDGKKRKDIGIKFAPLFHVDHPPERRRDRETPPGAGTLQLS